MTLVPVKGASSYNQAINILSKGKSGGGGVIQQPTAKSSQLQSLNGAALGYKISPPQGQSDWGINPAADPNRNPQVLQKMVQDGKIVMNPQTGRYQPAQGTTVPAPWNIPSPTSNSTPTGASNTAANPYNLPDDLVAGMTQSQQLQSGAQSGAQSGMVTRDMFRNPADYDNLTDAQKAASGQMVAFSDSAGGQQGTQPSYAPGEMVTTPGFNPAVPEGVSGTGVLQDMETQRQIAQQGNIDRYNQIMEGYGKRETDMIARNEELLAMTEGWGKAQREQLATKFEKQGAGLTQEMINRGMYNTGALDSARRGMDRDQQYQQLQMEDALNRQIMDYKRGLSNEEFANRDARLQFMERVDEQGPTMDDAYKYSQTVGVGNAQIPTYDTGTFTKPGQWTPGTANGVQQAPADVGSTPGYNPINVDLQFPNTPTQEQHEGEFDEWTGGGSGGGTGGGGGGTGGGGNGTGEAIPEQNSGNEQEEGKEGEETPTTGEPGSSTGGTGGTGGTTGGTSGTGGTTGTGGPGDSGEGPISTNPTIPGKVEGPGEGTGEGGPAGEWQEGPNGRVFVPADITGGDFYKEHIAPQLKRNPNWDWVTDPIIRAMAPTPLGQRIDQLRANRQAGQQANTSSAGKYIHGIMGP